MDIVLVEPDIPWNTGNIGRTCVATQTPLHLVEPLGFSLDDRFLKRAGLDYWKDLDLTVHESFEECMKSKRLKDKPVYLFSRFAKKPIWKVHFPHNAVLVFGSETKGLSTRIKNRYPSRLIRIPTVGPVRSLNLSTAVGIALFEGIRQNQV